MRVHNSKWNRWGRRMLVLLLLCGILVPALPLQTQEADAASVTYTYNWIKRGAELPKDDQWHDYFIAWVDTEDSKKTWFTDYHWYTASGESNIDTGGVHYMQYKAASTLANSWASSFTSKDCMGHMQIKYAGEDKDNNAPMY